MLCVGIGIGVGVAVRGAVGRRLGGGFRDLVDGIIGKPGQVIDVVFVVIRALALPHLGFDLGQFTLKLGLLFGAEGRVVDVLVEDIGIGLVGVGLVGVGLVRVGRVFLDIAFDDRGLIVATLDLDDARPDAGRLGRVPIKRRFNRDRLRRGTRLERSVRRGNGILSQLRKLILRQNERGSGPGLGLLIVFQRFVNDFSIFRVVFGRLFCLNLLCLWLFRLGRIFDRLFCLSFIRCGLFHAEPGKDRVQIILRHIHSIRPGGGFGQIILGQCRVEICGCRVKERLRIGSKLGVLILGIFIARIGAFGLQNDRADAAQLGGDAVALVTIVTGLF